MSRSRSPEKRQEEEDDDGDGPPSGISQEILPILLYNNLEYVGERMIAVKSIECQERIELWKAFEKFYNLLELPQNGEGDFGRLFNTRRMAEVVVATSLAIKMSDTDISGSGLRVSQVQSTLPDTPMTEWTSSDWEALHELMETIRENLLRKDVDKLIFEDNGQDSSVDGRRARDSLYTSKYNRVVKLIKLHKALSPLRNALAKLPKDADENDKELIGEDVVKALWTNFVEEKDEMIHQVLGKMFRGTPSEMDRRKMVKESHLPLRSINLLRATLEKKFGLGQFVKRLHRLLRECLQDVFPRRPILNEVYLNGQEDQENRDPGIGPSTLAEKDEGSYIDPEEDDEDADFKPPAREQSYKSKHHRKRRNRGAHEEEEEEEEDDGNIRDAVRGRRSSKSRRLSSRRARDDDDNSSVSETSEDSEDDPPQSRKEKTRRGHVVVDENKVLKLVKTREVLRGVVDKDPIEDARRIAALVPQGNGNGKRARLSSSYKKGKKVRRGGSLLEQKATATRLRFNDSEEEDPLEDDSEDSHDGPNLSALPKQRDRSRDEGTPPRKSRKSQTKKYIGRRFWTDEEKGAIKEGVRAHGAGKWKEIKDEYPILLSDRTSSQVKDCYRTMSRKGEL